MENYTNFLKNYNTIYREATILKELFQNTKDRYRDLSKEMALSFGAIYENEEDIDIEITQQEVYNILRKNDDLAIMPIEESEEIVFYDGKLGSQIKERQLFDFETYELILIILNISTVNLDKNTLKSEIENLRKMFETKVLINIVGENDNSQNKVLGGMIIFIKKSNSETSEDIKEPEEFILDGVSSKDKKKFVSALINRYLKDHPNLTFEELKKNLSPLHNENKIINDLDSIRKWKDEGHIVVWSGETFFSKDGVRFKVYNQWKENFNKVIDFAKENNYIK